MREKKSYLFKGKRKEDGKVVIGRLLADDVIVPSYQTFEIEAGYILTTMLRGVEVYPESVELLVIKNTSEGG